MPADAPTATPTRDDTVRTVSFVSLGCPKNLVDSEKMLGTLAEDGIAPVAWNPDDAPSDLSESGSEQDDRGLASEDNTGDIQPADAVVINTCGFLEASKQESLSVIKQAIAAKDRGELKRVVVAGCLVQRHRAKMLEWAPGIDALIGVFDRDRITEAVTGTKPERTSLSEHAADGPKYWITANALTAAKERGKDTVGLTVNGKDGRGIGYFESDAARLRLTPRHYAYLRMSEGCNQGCAFCTIPSIRGKMRSKDTDAIVQETRELVRDGAFELMLIGQDTTSYGDDVGTGLGQVSGGGHFRAGLPKLLKTVSDTMTEEAGMGWLRLMYAYPSNFTDEIIDAFAELIETGRLCKYLDIPLQHASDSVLTAMRRHVSADQQRELMLKLRERIPGMAIRTTFISGFPGETESDHEQLLEFIDEIGFDAVGVFRYSREPGTPAAKMEDDPNLAVPEEVKERRQSEIMALQQEIAFEQARYVADQFNADDPEATGCRFDVLIDAPTDIAGESTTGVSHAAHIYKGRTYFQAPSIDATTYVHSARPLSPGELVPCTIVDASGYDLIARPIDELSKRVALPVMR